MFRQILVRNSFILRSIKIRKFCAKPEFTVASNNVAGNNAATQNKDNVMKDFHDKVNQMINTAPQTVDAQSMQQMVNLTAVDEALQVETETVVHENLNPIATNFEQTIINVNAQQIVDAQSMNEVRMPMNEGTVLIETNTAVHEAMNPIPMAEINVAGQIVHDSINTQSMSETTINLAAVNETVLVETEASLQEEMVIQTATETPVNYFSFEAEKQIETEVVAESAEVKIETEELLVETMTEVPVIKTTFVSEVPIEEEISEASVPVEEKIEMSYEEPKEEIVLETITDIPVNRFSFEAEKPTETEVVSDMADMYAADEEELSIETMTDVPVNKTTFVSEMPLDMEMEMEADMAPKLNTENEPQMEDNAKPIDISYEEPKDEEVVLETITDIPVNRFSFEAEIPTETETVVEPIAETPIEDKLSIETMTDVPVNKVSFVSEVPIEDVERAINDMTPEISVESEPVIEDVAKPIDISYEEPKTEEIVVETITDIPVNRFSFEAEIETETEATIESVETLPVEDELSIETMTEVPVNKVSFATEVPVEAEEQLELIAAPTTDDSTNDEGPTKEDAEFIKLLADEIEKAFDKYTS